VPYNVLVPPAWEVEADGANVYYTQRAQVACLPVPPSCQQQGTLERVPRCGGAPTPLTLPFNGDVALRAGGGKVYVRASKDGFYRVDGQTGALDKMDIAAACVYGFAANATSVLVADTCGDRVLRAPHTGTALTELRSLPSVSLVGASAETAYAATSAGVFWVRLDTGASGKLITADAYFDLYQVSADARAVWLLYRAKDSSLRVARLPLDGSAPDVFSSAALNGVPTIAVADGYCYFLSYTPPASTGTLVRVPSAGGPPEIVAPSVVYTDVAAYGTRAYFTTQGVLRTAR
jgi:hypothetical protein